MEVPEPFPKFQFHEFIPDDPAAVKVVALPEHTVGAVNDAEMLFVMFT